MSTHDASLSGTTEQVAFTEPYLNASAVISSFTPLKSIKTHFCAFHTYATDRDRHVESHHFCTHLTEDLHQCIIYDGPGHDEHGNKSKGIEGRRLIGIEYIVTEKLFVTLPEEEKKYWHSHKYEVESGMLQMMAKDLVPGIVTDQAEKPAMLELQKTWGKTTHTWAFDKHPDLPLGPPSLMMSYTADGQIPAELVEKRDQKWGLNSQHKRELRSGPDGYLTRDYSIDGKGGDQFEHDGKAIEFVPKEVAIDVAKR